MPAITPHPVDSSHVAGLISASTVYGCKYSFAIGIGLNAKGYAPLMLQDEHFDCILSPNKSLKPLSLLV